MRLVAEIAGCTIELFARLFFLLLTTITIFMMMTTSTTRKSRPSEAPPTVLTKKIGSFDGAISASVVVTVVTLGSASVGSASTIIGAA